MSMILKHIYIFVLSAIALGVTIPAGAQEAPTERTLSLEEAEARALEANGDLEAARARVEVAEAGVRQASSFVYPVVALDAGSVRSDDPVAVFGTKLRQERFAQEDFSIAALNRPDAVTDWTAGAGARWRLLDPSAWAGREAARRDATAAEAGLERKREAVVHRTRILYLNGLATRADAAAAETALEAARATLEMIRARRAQGYLTDADVLQARAEVASARARQSNARARTRDARIRLGVHLGWAPDTLPRLTDPLLEGHPPLRSPGGADRVRVRADLRALERGVEAAGARVTEATRSRYPTVEAFGRLSSHGAELTGDRSANWTAGVELSWPLFTGFAREGAVDRARAERRAAEAAYGQRVLEARAEVMEARRRVEAAREGADAADAAAEAATEARRLVRRRFREGMATTVDLLQADARAAEMEARALGARTRLWIAAMTLEFVRGGVPADHQNNERGDPS